MPKKLIISDANVLIDMEVGHLVEAMFRLPFQFAVPDALFRDELSPRHAHLLDLGLSALELNSAGVARAVELIQRYSHLRTSRYDLFAAALAVQEKCSLLTGDADLRLVCDQEGIEVHGTIWLVEQLHVAALVDADAAEAAYGRMLLNRSRLPAGEIEAQLRRFRHKSS